MAETCGYCFGPAEPVAGAIARLVMEQASLAVRTADDPSRPDRDVHQLRVACKRMRAVLALPQRTPELEATISQVAELGRTLSTLRDAAVIQRWLKRLPTNNATTSLSKELEGEQRAAYETLAPVTRRVADALEVLAHDIPSLDPNAGFELIRPGLLEAYRKAKKSRLRSAVIKPHTAPRLHRWRKRVKRHGYHLELLAPSDPAFYLSRLATVRRIGSRLGEWRDLELVAERINHKTTRAEIACRQDDVLAPLIQIGACVFAGEPEALIAQMALRWRAWRSSASAPVAG